MRNPINELWGNLQPVCPYCKATQERDKKNGIIKCGSCEKKFLVQTNVVTEYSTVGDCSLNNELPHELVPYWSADIKLFTCRKCHGEAYDWDLVDGAYAKLTKDQYVIIPREGNPL